jgi:hypothetical protein
MEAHHPEGSVWDLEALGHWDFYHLRSDGHWYHPKVASKVKVCVEESALS